MYHLNDPTDSVVPDAAREGGESARERKTGPPDRNGFPSVETGKPGNVWRS